MVPREDLLTAAGRVRELEKQLFALQAASAGMAPAASLKAAHDEIRKLRDTCVLLEDGSRRVAAAEAAAKKAKEEALVALQEMQLLRSCLEKAVPRAQAEAAAAELEGLTAEVAWLRRLVASMAQVCRVCRLHTKLRREKCCTGMLVLLVLKREQNLLVLNIFIIGTTLISS